MTLVNEANKPRNLPIVRTNQATKSVEGTGILLSNDVGPLGRAGAGAASDPPVGPLSRTSLGRWVAP